MDKVKLPEIDADINRKQLQLDHINSTDFKLKYCKEIRRVVFETNRLFDGTSIEEFIAIIKEALDEDIPRDMIIYTERYQCGGLCKCDNYGAFIMGTD